MHILNSGAFLKRHQTSSETELVAALVNKPHVFPDAIGQVENAEIEDEEQLFANELVVIEKENDGDTEFANE